MSRAVGVIRRPTHQNPLHAARQQIAECRETAAELRQALAASQSQLDQANNWADANQQALLEMAGKLAERSDSAGKPN